MVRQLLGKLIEQSPGLTLGGSAASAEEALDLFSNDHRPDLVLVDISLPGMDGIELIGIIAERWPEILSLAVSGHDESLYARAAFKAGARGYVMKGKLVSVREAIRQVADGGRYVSEELGAADEFL